MTWQVPLNYMYVCKLLVHLIWKLYSFMNDIVNFRKWCVTGSTLTCTARSWCTYWPRRRRVDPTSGDCARNYRKVLKPGQYTVQWTEFSLYSIFAKYKKKLEFKLKMTYHLTGIRLNESCKKWFRILNHKQNYGLGILMVFERRLIYCLTSREMDVTPITLALSGAAAYPRACQALSSMLSKNALNPADITIVSFVYLQSRIIFCLLLHSMIQNCTNI